MGPLHSEIPLSFLSPKAWPIIVAALKDFFFIIPLKEQGREKLLLHF